jgi:Uncharacterized protein conserved in bacteria
MGILDKFLDAIRLNDDYDDDEFFDDDVIDEEPAPEDKPKSRFFKKMNDDLDDADDYYDDDYDMPEKKPFFAKKEKASPFGKPKTSSKITPMRKKSAGGMGVCVIKPTSMEDTREIADTLIANSTVLLNLEGLDVDVAQRIIDFSSGSCYSLGGGLQKVSSYIFILTPDNVEVSGDFQDILSGAVDLSSAHSNY